MTPNEVAQFLARAADGQTIRVQVASGRVFDGIYDAALSTPEEALYFETMEGQALCAEWDKVTSIEYRSSRVIAGRMMVPPEHPLSGAGPARVRSDGMPLKPHTSRNR